MKILLTGATGFLGSFLTAFWVQAGHQLTVLTRPTSSLRRIAPLLPKLQVLRCTTDEQVISAVNSAAPDIIVHTACCYGRDGKFMLQLFDTNIRLGVVLIQGLLVNQASRITFINTGTVLQAEVSNYALSKQQFSAWGRALAQQYPQQLQFIDVALQHMYGPGDERSKFTSHVLYSCMNNVPELALTAGEQQRDFIYIDDVVDAYDAIIRNIPRFSVSERIEVGSGQAPTVRELVELIHRITNSKTKLNFGAIPYRPSEAFYCRANISRMQQCGWRPRFGLVDGIRRTIEKEFNA